MALSGNVRIGALLGVVLPFCTYLYSAQQQRLEQTRNQHQARQQEIAAAEAKDRDMAVKLQDTLRRWKWPGLIDAADANAVARDRGTAALCEFLFGEARLAYDGVYGPQALGVVVGMLDAAPPQSGEGAADLGCQCRNVPRAIELEDLFSDTAGKMPPSRRRQLSQPVAALQKIYAQCPDTTPKEAAAVAVASAAVVEPPKRVAAPPPSRGRGPASVAPAPAPAPSPSPVATVAASAAPPAVVTAAYRARQLARRAVIETLRMRVYIQIPSAADLPAAECLKRELVGYGYLLPPIENVGQRAPDRVELRYFKTAERPAAETLLADMREAAAACVGTLPSGAAPGSVELAAFTRIKTSARPFHFELWLAQPPTTPATE